MNKNNIEYKIGMRDMLANIFMEIRISGVEETLKKMAEMIKDNPHAEHYLKNYAKKE